MQHRIPLIVVTGICFLAVLTNCEDLIYYASSIAVYKNSAFLALPRNSDRINVTNPTLIEFIWNGNGVELSIGRKFSFDQVWGKCDHLQNVVSVDVESKKSRLWILDGGNNKCPPKLLIYSLQANYVIHSSKFYNFVEEELSYLTVDSSTEYGTLCYIGFKMSNQIIVFSFNNLNWATVFVKSGSVHPQRMAISPINLKMYLTCDNNDDMLALNLSEVRDVGRRTVMLDHSLVASYVGKKLGPSTGVVIDIAGGFNYFLPRDYAVVRWNIEKPLLAEHHDVLLQSFEILPDVTHMFNDPQSNVWALVSKNDQEELTSEAEPDYSIRVVQISTFLRRRFKLKIMKLL